MGLYERFVCPYLVDLALRSGHVKKQRTKVLASVTGNILEIGFGTGLNLDHYPKSVTSLTVLDPSEGMHAKARARLEKSRIEVEAHRLSAERLPFEDGRFDPGVCTYTPGPSPVVSAALDEIRRVLKPGGRFHFLEHVASEDPRILRRQNRLNPIQKVIGCGCHLNRDAESLIRQAGFEIPHFERFHMPKTLRLLSTTVRGLAINPT